MIEPTQTQMMVAIEKLNDRLENEMSAVVTRFRGVESKLEAGQQKFTCIERKLDAQSVDISRTREIAEALEGLKTLGKFCSGVAGFLTAVGVILFSIWGVMKLAAWSVLK